ncbi:ABC transporter permease [Streptomyces sediminimaris]|uniref:ABC transporter permease n=1 Tax=Streptomyces sediminimaris TaxID=3383721 RepID=UPI00399A6BB8
MSALGRVVRAGVTRRRVQTLVMALTSLMAVTASVVAAGLLVASRAPFDHAMAAQRGAQLTAQFDGTKASAARLTATARTSGVTAAAGPFRTLTLNVRTASASGALPEGVTLPPLTVVGRADQGGPVDRLGLVTGRWATRPGEIVLAYGGVPLQPGARLEVSGLPGRPMLTVVGLARSVTGSAEAWVTPAQAKALSVRGAGPTYQMLYRFGDASTDAQISAHRTAIGAAVPKGALTGTLSCLTVRRQATANAMAFVPFVAAFGILGLAMSVLVIGIVVSGAVGAATWRIGVLKSLGFTPGHIVRAYVAQALVPAAAGCVLGVVLGNLLAQPALAETDRVYGGASSSIPWWIDVVVPATALVLVAGAALGPALRAGRLRTVEAITLGRAPGAGRGRRVRRLVGRLPLPRAVSLGLAHPFARPARSLTTAAAVGLAAVTVTFGTGLALTLGSVQSSRELNAAAPVVVSTAGGHGRPGAQVVHVGADAKRADPAKVTAVLRQQQDTRRFYGTATAQVHASGITGRTEVTAYRGDASWAAPRMVSGSWLTGPGQAVVTTRFLHAAQLRVGDTLALSTTGRSTSVRIVGEAFFTENQGMEVLTPAATLTALGLDAAPSQYFLQPARGVSLGSYLTALNSALDPTGAVASAADTGKSGVIVAMDGLIAILTGMLVVVAGLGVLNTVVLDTRERVRDLGVMKAVGMTPRQVLAMVITSVAGVGLLAGVVGVPLGVALHHFVTPLMGHAIGMNLPGSVIAVYHSPVLFPLALGGIVVATAGALLPAGWAARADTATTLRTE